MSDDHIHDLSCANAVWPPVVHPALRIVCRLYIRTTQSSQVMEAWSHPMVVAVVPAAAKACCHVCVIC